VCWKVTEERGKLAVPANRAARRGPRVSGKRLARVVGTFAAVCLAVLAFYSPFLDDVYAGMHHADGWGLLWRVMKVHDAGSALHFVFQMMYGFFAPVRQTLYLVLYTLFDYRLYPALKVGQIVVHTANVLGAYFLLKRNLREGAGAVLGAVLFGTSYGTFTVMRGPLWWIGKALGPSMIIGALIALELFRSNRRKVLLGMSCLLCVLAPATAPLGVVAAPLCALYAVLVGGFRSRRAMTLLLAYLVSSMCFFGPLLLLHGRSLAQVLRDHPKKGRIVTTSPGKVLEMTTGVVLRLWVKERYIRFYEYDWYSKQPWYHDGALSRTLGWFQRTSPVVLGLAIALSGAAVVLLRSRPPRIFRVQLLQFAAFCFLGVLVTVLVIGVPRFAQTGSAINFLNRSRYLYAAMFFLGALVASLAEPGLIVARLLIGRAGPWALAAAVALPSVLANRVALDVYDLREEGLEVRPGAGAIMADLRRLNTIAEYRAASGLATTFPSRPLPARGRGMPLHVLAKVATGDRPSAIHWVEEVDDAAQGDFQAIVKDLPALRSFYERYYPDVLVVSRGRVTPSAGR
jgi:MFS family permease